MKDNQWKDIANKASKIQDAKNIVLNDRVLELVEKYSNGKKAFDYGCGWGEFAGVLESKGYDTCAYDDADEMVSQAIQNHADINFIYKKDFHNSFNSHKSQYDVVVSNLVICILNKKMQEELLHNIKELVRNDGIIVLSLCHPAFDYLSDSIVTKRKTPYKVAPKYTDSFRYRKMIHENRVEFDDYHHPLQYYFNLFKKLDLKIVEISESKTLKTNNFPDFLILVLQVS